MRFTFVPLTCLALALLASPVLAKEKKHEKQMDPQAMMEVWKQMATPGEPHKIFAGLAGSWTTTTKEWMEPGKPPTESTGTAEMKMLLDGRFLYQEFTGNMMGQPYLRRRDRRLRQHDQEICDGLDGYDGDRDLHDGRHGQRRRQDHHAERVSP